MSKTAEVLEAGAEQLREWAEWAKTDCFETFEEWFLGVKLTDEEKPAIVTPPPKHESTDEIIARMRCDERSPLFVPKWCVEDVLRSVHRAMIDIGIQTWSAMDYSSGEFTWRLRCFKCDERLVVAAPYDEAHFRTHVRDIIGEWASRHGHDNCVRAMVVHGGIEGLNV